LGIWRELLLLARRRRRAGNGQQLALHGNAFWDLTHSALAFPDNSSATYGQLTQFWVDSGGACPAPRGRAGLRRGQAQRGAGTGLPLAWHRAGWGERGAALRHWR